MEQKQLGWRIAVILSSLLLTIVITNTVSSIFIIVFAWTAFVLNVFLLLFWKGDPPLETEQRPILRRGVVLGVIIGLFICAMAFLTLRIFLDPIWDFTIFSP